MTDPLFVADLATLQAKLRLSGVPTANTDVTAILNECILRARLAFINRLGTTRVGQLLAITFVENFLTADESLRALANATEVRLVYCGLLEKLPVTFMDSSGSAKNDWNEEALTREKNGMRLAEELDRCNQQIEADMQVLSGAQVQGSVSPILVWDGEPDCPRSTPSAPLIGRSLNSTPRNFPHLTQDPPTL